MRARAVGGLLSVVGAGAFVLAAVVVSPARSAEPQKVNAKGDVPDGYVLVDPDSLRRLVHEEVERQLQDFFNQVRHEQQERAAAGRLQAISSMAATLRSQIALYRLQHNDQVPTLDQIGDGFKFLTLQTDATGKPSTGPNAVGPYLQQPVVNPLTGKSKVVALGKATSEAGWSYDPNSGMVKAVLPQRLESQLKDRISARDVEFAAAN